MYTVLYTDVTAHVSNVGTDGYSSQWDVTGPIW
jgi:hypothetical protein